MKRGVRQSDHDAILRSQISAGKLETGHTGGNIISDLIRAMMPGIGLQKINFLEVITVPQQQK